MKPRRNPSRPSRYDFLPKPARSRMPIVRNFLEQGDEMRCKKPAEGDADTPKANVSGHSGRVRKPSRLRSGDRQRRSAPGLTLSSSGSCWMLSAPEESTAASSFRGSMNEKRRVERPPVQVDRSQEMRRRRVELAVEPSPRKAPNRRLIATTPTWPPKTRVFDHPERP